MHNTFGRQAIPMTWDFAEANPFSGATGSFENMLSQIVKAVRELPAVPPGEASQWPAQDDCGFSNLLISTDPPYYDNIGYADLSDFFYVWMRQSLKPFYPELFATLQVPKAEELIATPYRFDGSRQAAKEFFEEGMFTACQQIFREARDDLPVTIYYAFKQKAAVMGDSGWETMLSAIIRAGFMITGTWPARTELVNRSNALETNALASSIVLVCRKRPADAGNGTRSGFMDTLEVELPKAVRTLQRSSIAPVDMAQSAIGPGIAIYSQWDQVLEPDGTPVKVGEALRIINQQLDAYLTSQSVELDEATRFCLDLYSQSAFDEITFGEADVLARAKNISVEAIEKLGVLEAEKGKVRLLKREELPDVDEEVRCVWLLTQQLTGAMQRGGSQETAQIAFQSPRLTAAARDLAYRLYSLAEHKGWSEEALAYNGLISSWSQVAEYVNQLKKAGKQMSM